MVNAGPRIYQNSVIKKIYNYHKRNNNNLEDVFSVYNLGIRFGSIRLLNSSICIYYSMYILLLQIKYDSHANIQGVFWCYNEVEHN